jgi:hypothetical protein
MALRAFATFAVFVGLLVAGCAAPDHEPGHRADAAGEPEGASPPAGGDTAGAPAPASGSSGVHDLRGRYPDLPDMGDTREYFRAHGSRTLVDRGYFRGDLQLAGAGLKKEGAGPDESVIDGHLEVRGDGWVLTGLTITGDVVVRGEGNDLSGCQVLGRLDARGSGNVLPSR